MPSSCHRGQVRSRGRCVKKCKAGYSRSRTTNRCYKRSGNTSRKARKPTPTPKRKAKKPTPTPKRKAKKPTPTPKRKARKPTRTAGQKVQRKPVNSGRLSRTRAQVNSINNMFRKITGSRGRVAKVSARGNIRPSAAQAYRDGARIGSVACYDGQCKRLRLDKKNNRAYWGV